MAPRPRWTSRTSCSPRHNLQSKRRATCSIPTTSMGRTTSSPAPAAQSLNRSLARWTRWTWWAAPAFLRLAYSASVGAIVAVPNRTDYVYTYGGGMGWRMGRDMRAGFNVDHANLTPAVDLYRYHGLGDGM